MALFDALTAQTPQGAQLRAGLLGMGAGLLQGSTGHYGQFGPALGQGFAGFGQGMQNAQLMQQRQEQMDQQNAVRRMEQQRMQQEMAQQQGLQDFLSGASGLPSGPPVGNAASSTGARINQAITSPNPMIRQWGLDAHKTFNQNPTSLMQNVAAAGLTPGTPEYQAAIMGGINQGPTINIGGDSSPGLGKLSSDYGYVLDPETRQPVIDPDTGLPRAAPVPGSPAALALKAEEDARAAAKRNASDYARTVTQDIGIANDYLGQIEGMSAQDGVVGANIRGARANIAGTPESNMKAFVDSALSNVTLDTMNRMRESSPAGATGFGNMSEKQMEVIRGVLGNWKPTLPVEDQRMILHRLGNFYLDVQFGTEAERNQAVRDGRMSKVDSDAINELYYPETRDLIGRRLDSVPAQRQQQLDSILGF